MRIRPLILTLLFLSLLPSLGCWGRRYNAYRCQPSPCCDTHLPATAVPVSAGCCPG